MMEVRTTFNGVEVIEVAPAVRHGEHITWMITHQNPPGRVIFFQGQLHYSAATQTLVVERVVPENGDGFLMGAPLHAVGIWGASIEEGQ
jgi:hypothetical protein